MRSVSSSRKTRKLRIKPRFALTSNTSELTTDISCAEAQRELRVRATIFSQSCRSFSFALRKNFWFHIKSALHVYHCFCRCINGMHLGCHCLNNYCDLIHGYLWHSTYVIFLTDSQAISETVTDPDRIDLSRMNMLLRATIQIRQQNPVEELPVYLLNAAVVSISP